MSGKQPRLTHTAHRIVACSLIALCLAVNVGLSLTWQTAEEAWTKAEQKHLKQRQAEQAQGAAQAEIDALRPRILHLLDAPWAAPPKPAQRPKLLLEIRQQLDLQAFQYAFQKPESDPQAPAFIRQRLALQVPLRHEIELLLLLNALQQRADALITPRHCRLTRASDTGLTADCELDWHHREAPS